MFAFETEDAECMLLMMVLLSRERLVAESERDGGGGEEDCDWESVWDSEKDRLAAACRAATSCRESPK